MSKIKKVYLTFDLDFRNYVNNWDQINEIPFIKNKLVPLFKRIGIKATWFIRLDKNIESIYGSPDYILKKHKALINELKNMGHSIAWHPHFYKNWKQNCEEKEILSEIDYLIPYVNKYNLNISRIGWSYMSNKIMEKLENIGMKLDSSALPRPKYEFEETKKDWTITNQIPYYPSKEDYRRKKMDNEKEYKLLEFPMTTFVVNAPYDKLEVIRYCNLSFKNKFIINGIFNHLKKYDNLITITHPYELMKNSKHKLISFNIKEFVKNIEYLNKLHNKCNKEIKFKTLKEMIYE